MQLSGDNQMSCFNYKIFLTLQLFEYERLVEVLLHSASEMAQDSFVQRIGIYLLNSLACQVGGKQKKRLGDLGLINVSQRNIIF